MQWKRKRKKGKKWAVTFLKFYPYQNIGPDDATLSISLCSLPEEMMILYIANAINF